jgi:hypothetical protein
MQVKQVTYFALVILLVIAATSCHKRQDYVVKGRVVKKSDTLAGMANKTYRMKVWRLGFLRKDTDDNIDFKTDTAGYFSFSFEAKTNARLKIETSYEVWEGSVSKSERNVDAGVIKGGK